MMPKQTFGDLIRDHGVTAAVGTVASGVIIAAWAMFKRSMVNEAAVAAITEAFQREMRSCDKQRDEYRQEMYRQIGDIHKDLRDLRGDIQTDLRDLRNQIMGARR
jgi:hypothetical protein